MFMRHALRNALLLFALALGSLPAVADTTTWVATSRFPAAEAVQAAAATDTKFFAIASTQIARYDRHTGQREAVSSGSAQHLNSGYFWQGRLYCAHSNYPRQPEQSEIKVLEPDSMQLSTFHDFGNYGGSLTWVVRHDDFWWCNFARYGADNAQTFLVQFNDQWQEKGRWTYAQAVLRELGTYSLSGGMFLDGHLIATGHDDPVLFRLRVPSSAAGVVQLVEKQSVPFTGQGIAFDAAGGGLVGIHRARREVVFAQYASPEPVVAAATTEPAPQRLPRDQLLVYRDEQQRLQPVRTVADWQHRRAEILAGAQSVMGPLPGPEKRCPLDMRVEEEVDCGTYVRRLITYASEPDSRVPAYLLVPKKLLENPGQRVPAILCLHGTDNVVGHGVVVGLGGRPNRQYASELAERGYVTLAPNYPLLAKYQPNVLQLGWESGTMKAIWDNRRGLDLLATLPFVDPAGFGAIGHSLGGHNSVYTAVFDERIKAVVTSCGLDSFLDYYDGAEKVWFPEKGWTQTRYMPKLAGYRGRLAE
ncbi:MAG: alpha/beta hydrolase family protein, partial [Pirellulaceae bacterium]